MRSEICYETGQAQNVTGQILHFICITTRYHSYNHHAVCRLHAICGLYTNPMKKQIAVSNLHSQKQIEKCTFQSKTIFQDMKCRELQGFVWAENY